MTQIVQKGDPILREQAQPITEEEFGSDWLQQVIEQMKEALNTQEDGAALAAPQIGIGKQLFVVSHRIFQHLDGSERYDDDKEFINPEIIKRSRETEWMDEGCLSVRPWYGQVKRHQKVRLRAYDIMGNKFHWNASGLMAQIFQHETDHLAGVLFVDKARDLTDQPLDQTEHN